MSVKYHGVVVPESTDLADGPKAFRDLTDFGNAMPIFATLAERDGWTAPPDGALCTVLKSAGVAANVVQQYIAGAGWKSLETPVIGEIKMWPTATAPVNHLLCNGAAVPAGSEYDILRSIVGANVPNLVDKFVLGSGVKAINATGGAATVTLTVPQMPGHAHTALTGMAGTHSHTGLTSTVGDHTHLQNSESVANVNIDNRQAVAIPPAAGPGWWFGIGAHTTQGAGTHNHGISPDGSHNHALTSEGGGQAHENMPPYVVMAYIIRAK